MSINFHANQYEKAFHPSSLQNWEVPKGFPRHPKSKDGCSQVISSGQGHLLPGVTRSRASPWGKYVGTWDMPIKIPGTKITNHTARAEHAIEQLTSMKAQGDLIMSGQLKRCKIPDPLPVIEDVNACTEVATTSGLRSGAQNPIPDSVMPKVGSPQVGSPKPVSPVASNHGDCNENNEVNIDSSRIPVPQHFDTE